MVRTRDYKTVAKATPAAATAGTVTFNASELYSDKVCQMHIGIENDAASTNHDIGMITNILILAAGNPIINCSLTQLRALLQRFSKANYVPATSAHLLTIPFNIFDDQDYDRADRCQFPAGANIQVILTLAAAGSGGNTTGTGKVIIGYTFTDQPAELYPIFLTQQMGITAAAAAVVNGAFPIQEPGQLKALVFPTTGLAQFRLILNGDQMLNMGGPASLACPSNLVQEAEQLENGTTVTDPLAISTPFGRNAAFSRSQIEVLVGTTWAGAANEVAMWAIRRANVPLNGGGG